MLAWLAACAPAPTADVPEAVEVPEAPVSLAAPPTVPAEPEPVETQPVVVEKPAPAAVSAVVVPAPAPAPEPIVAPAPPGPGQHGPVPYALDPDRSVLFVLVKYDRSSALGGQLGHDHAIAATGWAGSVTWDPDDIDACEVNVTVPVEGLAVDPPGTRAAAGLEGETPDADKRKIAANFRGPRQLDADRYPEIRFRSTSCSLDSGHLRVSGELTIHGVTQPVELPATITADEGSFHAVGTLRAKHTDFGFEPFTNALGAIKNANGLAWTIDVRGSAQ